MSPLGVISSGLTRLDDNDNVVFLMLVAAPGVLFRDFFRTDRDGVEKGIVLVGLRSLL